MKHTLTALAALLLLGSPLAASAQDVPSYATSAYGDDQQIRGRIANFDGGYNLQVRDDRGYVDTVQLHNGTIINPTGLTLAPGMVVSIVGYNSGSYFAANEVDTPYTYYNNVPYYSGHPYGYYGSGISLDFFFGNTGWWHGNDFTGGYAYDNGIRVYRHANFRNYYAGGTFQGRNYVAPAARGGYVRNVNRTTIVNRPVNTTNVTTTRNSAYAPRPYAAPRAYAAPRTVGVPQQRTIAPQPGGYAAQTRGYAPRTYGNAQPQTHVTQNHAPTAQYVSAPRGGPAAGSARAGGGGGHPSEGGGDHHR